jgi:succinate dehydrogenase flavin-adding protein (antitoxin of CptAB toxin-antitoxin module)
MNETNEENQEKYIEIVNNEDMDIVNRLNSAEDD